MKRSIQFYSRAFFSRSYYLLLLLLLISTNGMTQIEKPSCDMVLDADIIHDLNTMDGYSGMMFDSLVAPFPIPLCLSGGGAHNMTWFAFIGGCGDYTLEITPFDCSLSETGDIGIQYGIYTDCSFDESVVCDPLCKLEVISISSDQLFPGKPYYFFIDGCYGSVCHFTLNISGEFIPFNTGECTVFEVEMVGPDTICVGGTTQVSTSDTLSGYWMVSDSSVATVSNTGVVTGINDGQIICSYHNQNGLISKSDTITILGVTIFKGGVSSLCLGETKQLSASNFVGAVLEGTWTSSDNAVATIDYTTGIITPIGEGTACFVFVDNDFGCTSSCVELTFEDCSLPCDSNFVRPDWTLEYLTVFDLYYDIVDWTIGPLVLDNGYLEDIFFYDNNNGDVLLKRNDGNGSFLPYQFLLFRNQYHANNAGSSFHPRIFLKDMNNDGNNDIIIAQGIIIDSSGVTISSGKIIVYYQLSDNTFEEVKMFEVNQMELYMEDVIQFYDFDSNGYKDIVYASGEKTNVIFINDLNYSLSNDIMDLSECNFHLVDMNQDGLMDISHFSGIFYYNDDHTFTKEDNYLDFSCNEFHYFDDESEYLFTEKGIYIFNEVSKQFELCVFENNEQYHKVIEANILSSSKKEIVLLGDNDKIKVYKKPLTCNPNPITLDVVHSKPIDINNDGYTDFVNLLHFLEPITGNINPGNSHLITGTAYIDINENGTLDPGETLLKNVMIHLSPYNKYVLTDQFGQYSFAVEYAEYTIEAKINEGMWVSDSLSIFLVVNSHCNEGNNFGFVPLENPAEANLSVSHGIKRCGTETYFFIDFENIGSENLNGTVEFNFNPIVTYVDAGPKPISIGSSKLIFDIDNLRPFKRQTYTIVMLMPAGSTSLPILDFDVKLLDEESELLADYHISDQLRCSFDPNDKTSYPNREGEDNLTLFSESLDYTVRFQNTGNDTAFTVRIVDQLDENIKPNSVRVMSSSHPVKTIIEDGNKLVFLFENINLVDSTTSFLASQGYVTFRCDQKESRDEYTEIYNHADIIFDTNLPVITNEVKNTLVSTLCTSYLQEISVQFCPGGSYQGYTESGTYIDSLINVAGCDSIKILHITLYENPSLTLDTSICSDQYAYGENVTGDYEITIEASEGCDTILSLHLEVLEENDPLCTVAVNDEIETKVYIYPNPAIRNAVIKGLGIVDNILIHAADGRAVSIAYHQSENGEVQLDIVNLSEGFYYLEVNERSHSDLVYLKLMIIK